MDTHVLFGSVTVCQFMYLLKLVSHHGMSSFQLLVITCSIIISRLLYALHVWEGFLCQIELIEKITALFTYLRHVGYTNWVITES